MEEAVSSLAALNTLTDREINVLKRRFGVTTIDFDYLENNILSASDVGGGGSAPPSLINNERPPVDPLVR